MTETEFLNYLFNYVRRVEENNAELRNLADAARTLGFDTLSKDLFSISKDLNCEARLLREQYAKLCSYRLAETEESTRETVKVALESLCK